jgi:formylglycine-generating enzyme required for sulfatase activity
MASGVALSTTEITVEQFRACVDAGKCGTDTFQSSSAVPGHCNYGASDRDKHPMNCVNWFGAEQYCTSVGARLCTFEEWIAACSGPEGKPFPYGQTFEQRACHAASRENPAAGRPTHTLPAGALGTCEGGLPGLYDMAGNVMEWVSSCKDTYCKFLGGAYLGNEPIELFNSCKGPCGGNQKTFQSATIGVRCCRNSGT